MKTIHCIGDSHSCFFYGSDDCFDPSIDKTCSLLPGFSVYHLGASLAYNLCESGTTSRGRESVFDILKNRIAVGSRVMLCYGEVDCRYHIQHQANKQKKDIEVVVGDCIERYIAFIREIKAKGYEVLVWGVIPSHPDSALWDIEWPTLGTCEERNAVTRYFNEKLGETLTDESIPFVSLFDQLVDGNITKGQLYLEDKIHLSQKAMPAALAAIKQSYSEIMAESIS